MPPTATRPFSDTLTEALLRITESESLPANAPISSTPFDTAESTIKTFSISDCLWIELARIPLLCTVTDASSITRSWICAPLSVSNIEVGRFRIRKPFPSSSPVNVPAIAGASAGIPEASRSSVSTNVPFGSSAILSNSSCTLLISGCSPSLSL